MSVLLIAMIMLVLFLVLCSKARKRATMQMRNREIEGWQGVANRSGRVSRRLPDLLEPLDEEFLVHLLA